MSFAIVTLEKTDPRIKQVQLVATYAGRTVEFEKGDPTNFDRWNSGQKYPALRTEEGGVWGLNNILRHLARSTVHYPLYGEHHYEHSVVDSWLDWAWSELEVPASAICPAPKIEGLDPAFVHEVFAKIEASFDTLNKHLLNNTFLATRRVSIADFAVAFALWPLAIDYCDTGLRKKYSNVFRWFDTVINQPTFIAVLGQLTYSSKNPLPPLPKKQTQQKKKQQKKKEGGEEGDEGDDKEPDLEEVGEKLDLGYLGSLPASTFNLEKWKTVYANTNPTRPEALDYFWSNFDPQGYCLYFFTYKFFEECTIDFKTSNLFGGYLQRLDAVKQLSRFSLCSTVILKKEKFFYIYGVWLFRGPEIPVEFTKVDDFNYYNWTKVDVTNEQDKQFAGDIWAWTTLNDWGGRGEFNSGRSWGC